MDELGLGFFQRQCPVEADSGEVRVLFGRMPAQIEPCLPDSIAVGRLFLERLHVGLSQFDFAFIESFHGQVQTCLGHDPAGFLCVADGHQIVQGSFRIGFHHRLGKSEERLFPESGGFFGSRAAEQIEHLLPVTGFAGEPGEMQRSFLAGTCTARSGCRQQRQSCFIFMVFRKPQTLTQGSGLKHFLYFLAASGFFKAFQGFTVAAFIKTDTGCRQCRLFQKNGCFGTIGDLGEAGICQLVVLLVHRFTAETEKGFLARKRRLFVVGSVGKRIQRFLPLSAGEIHLSQLEACGFQRGMRLIQGFSAEKIGIGCFEIAFLQGVKSQTQGGMDAHIVHFLGGACQGKLAQSEKGIAVGQVDPGENQVTSGVFHGRGGDAQGLGDAAQSVGKLAVLELLAGCLIPEFLGQKPCLRLVSGTLQKGQRFLDISAVRLCAGKRKGDLGGLGVHARFLECDERGRGITG